MLLSSLAALASAAQDGCSQQAGAFFIRSQSTRGKIVRPYLTVNENTNSLSGAAKTGEPNQQWSWVVCLDGSHLVNKATGAQLSNDGRMMTVAESGTAWSYDAGIGTLQDVASKKWARIVKRKLGLRVSKRLRLVKKAGPLNGTPWAWFLWTLEDVQGADSIY